MILVAKAKKSLSKIQNAKCKMQNGLRSTPFRSQGLFLSAECGTRNGFAPLLFAHKERVNICQNILVLKFELSRPTVRILKNALVWMKDEQKKISLTGVYLAYITERVFVLLWFRQNAWCVLL